MATVQMNTRIDAKVKAAGDTVFESIGYTSTRVVRAIWGYAVRCANKPEEIESMLRHAEGLDSAEEQERAKKARLAEQGPHIFEEFLAEQGLAQMPQFDERKGTAAELREQVAVERALQKGWIDE